MNSDVALDGEPVIGSFTVDGLTYAVTGESAVELVSVDSSVILGGAAEGGEAEGSDEGHASEAGAASLALPESVAYEGADYALASIAPYAFYLSGATSVMLPATATDVDECAFRSSDVANVTVAEANPTYSSFDGALYSAGLASLLLIPGGRQGAVRIPSQASDVPASAFSHCALVTAISVDAGGAHLSSWEGLLYDADGTTLLRVPAGATEIAIREGCTTIAAGAMEACASLERINAPSTVTSISPDLFTAIPTVSLLAASLAGADDPGTAGEPSSQETAPQLTAMVALSTTDDDLPKIDPATVEVRLGQEVDAGIWEHSGFSVREHEQDAFPESSSTSLGQATNMYAGTVTVTVNSNGHVLKKHYVDHGNPSNNRAIGDVSSVDTVSRLFWWNSFNKDLELVTEWDYSNQSGYKCYQYWNGTPGYALKGFNKSKDAADGLPSIGGQAESATLYAIWQANKYKVSFSINGGKDEANNKPSDVTATFDSVLPAINANKPKKDGYTFKGWYDTSAATGGTMYYDASNKAVSGKTWDKAENTTLYARWAANPYAIAFDSQGGPEVPSISATYDQDVTLPAPGARNGYRFLGWNTEADGSGTTYRAGIALAKPNLATSGTATLFAQWDAVISAVVPLEVEAQVDVLGLEAPKEAQGCIESRCGEPLKVAEVKLTPLDGAKELFGEGNVSDVFLEVLAEGSTSPNARFSLGASATESDASKLQALTMASYGTRVPISYRFVMPPDVQTSLVEHADPKPVCTVAYTVVLQDPPQGPSA